jgi:hypothetical protein
MTLCPHVAHGIANAIENTAHKYFQSLGEERSAREFDGRFGHHAMGDMEAADAMVDWLIAYDPSFQQTLENLLTRLKEVFSRPPD